MKRRQFMELSLGASAALATGGLLHSCKKEKVDTAFSERLLPAPVGGGFSEKAYWIWGSSVVKGEDGSYHMFASRWTREVGFGNWVTNSEVVRAVSETAVGPYKYAETVFPPRGRDYFDGKCTHNPRVIKYRDKYLLYYFGTTYDFAMPDKDTPDVSEENWRQAWMNKRVGLAISDSPDGKWERLDRPVIEPRPGHWDASITSNPAPAVDPKSGKILLLYKSSTEGLTPPLLLGAAMAENPEGPYNRLSEEPIFRFETGDNHRIDVEDPYIWWSGKRYEGILKDRSGLICGEEGGGIHVLSDNGVDWRLAENFRAYTRNIKWDDGSESVQNHFERPFLLIEDGVPTHLFAATGTGPKAWQFDRTWNMVIPLKTVT